MKNRKPISPKLPKGRALLIPRSALMAAMASLGCLAEAAPGDDMGAMLTFYSAPSELTAEKAEGDDSQPAKVEMTVPQQVEPKAPAAVPAPADVVKSVQASQTPSPKPVQPRFTVDLSLPTGLSSGPVYGAGIGAGVGVGTSVSSMGQAESSLTYLRGMVDTALRISPEMKQADASWQAARGDVDEAKGARWPQVQVSANSPTLQSKKSDDYSNDGSTTVQMITPVYDFGAISHTIDSRKGTANAQEEAKGQTEVTVAYNTAAAVVELAHQQEALDISNRYVARMRELVDMLSQISDVDPGRRSEVVQARSRLLQAETSRDLVQSKVQEQKTTLAKLVGQDVTVPANTKWDWAPMPLNEALAMMNDQPALRQARWEKEAALANAESVKSSRMPKLNWVVGRSTGNNMLDNKEPWSTGLAVEWKAFSGGSASAAQRAAYARANAAEEKMESTRRESEYRIRNLAEQRDLSAARVGDYKALLGESDRVRKMFYDQWYHLGKRTLLDVLIAENEYYGHQIAASDTYYNSKTADLRIRAESSGLLGWLAPEHAAATH